MPYCDRCDRSFRSWPALQQHLDNSSNHHICDNCDLDFSTDWALTQHYVQSPHHHYCQRCDEDFDDDDDLKTHYEDEHHYCGICEKVSLYLNFFVTPLSMIPQQIFNSERGLHEHNRQKHWYCESCKRVFQNQNNLNSHLRSSIHKPAVFLCPGRNCNRSFISEAALVLHCEAGTCSSGVNRQVLNKVVSSMDRGSIITNPNRLLCDSPSSGRSTVWATSHCWNGTAFECVLCHREFRTLPALNSHLQSPVHEQSMYRCPPRWGGCNQDFRTLSGLFQHVESESCGVRRFQNNMRDAIGSLTDGMRRIAL